MMELDCDLSQIKNEELLRKMWQQSEDINRKKEIRSQLYKLRESRLRDLYQPSDIMSEQRTVSGFGKDPLTTSHGDSLADQSFQSLKSKEIRDSLSPTEMKFQSMALNHPNTTGWNVQSSSEVRPDGKGFHSETLATTDGVEKINGGTAEFKGRNEQQSSAFQDGDENNFIKKASESSKTHLQEKVVVGDENSGRTEMRTSSSTSTSSSQVIKSSSTTVDNMLPIDQGIPQAQQQPQKYILENNSPAELEQYYREQHNDAQHRQHMREQQIVEQQIREQREQKLHEQRINTSQNIQTEELLEKNKRYVDMDKATPEYQQHVQQLMQQPGEIISNTVEYPKPNVKMITTVKRLPDGTIVRNKRYETEEMTPSAAPEQQRTTTTTSRNVNNDRRDSQQMRQQTNTNSHPRDMQPSSNNRSPSKPDYVDNSNVQHLVHSDDVSNVETQFSSVKKSSKKYSTQTTSETVQEQYSPESITQQRNVKQDYSTQGFPSVRPDKLTQEYPGDRARPQQYSPTNAAPSARPFPSSDDGHHHVTERRIPTEDGGEMIIVSSQKQHNVKHQSNNERVIETVITDGQKNQQIFNNSSEKTEDYTTHGFPSAREPHQPQRQYIDVSQQSPRSPQSKIVPKDRFSPQDDVIVVSRSQSSKQSSNSERIIETEVIGEDGKRYIQRVQQPENITTYTVQTPETPIGDYPGSPRKTQPNQGFSTHGFPSARSPTKVTQHPPSFTTTQGFPSARETNRTNGTPTSPTITPIRVSVTKSQPRGSSPVKKTATTTTTTTERRPLHKEREVDAAHRAFASSLRSSSPVDSIRRSSVTDSHRQTPRSSVSSQRTFKRDVREGSHDSTVPSESSRISSGTVTRKSPGKTTVTTRVINSGSSSPRSTKSPSPIKSTTTTTTRTTTTTTAPKSPITKDVPKPDKSKTRITTTKSITTKKQPTATTTTTIATGSSALPSTTTTSTTTTTPPIPTPISPTKTPQSPPPPPPPPPSTTTSTTTTTATASQKPISSVNTTLPTADLSIFSLPNEAPLKPLIIHQNTLNANHKQEELFDKISSPLLEAVNETPCLKKQYYVVGPSKDGEAELEKSVENVTTSSPNTFPAPESSYRNRTNSPKSKIVEDYEEELITTRPSRPRSRPTSPTSTTTTTTTTTSSTLPLSTTLPSRETKSPEKNTSDELNRTVLRETTFDVNENDYLIPLDQEETVDARQTIKQGTTKFIEQERRPSGTTLRPKQNEKTVADNKSPSRTTLNKTTNVTKPTTPLKKPEDSPQKPRRPSGKYSNDTIVTEETTVRKTSPAARKPAIPKQTPRGSVSEPREPKQPAGYVREEITIEKTMLIPKKTPSPERPLKADRFPKETVSKKLPFTKPESISGPRKLASPERPSKPIRHISPDHKKSPSPDRPARFVNEQTTIHSGSPAPKKSPSPDRPGRFVTEETTTIKHVSPGQKKTPSPERPARRVTKETTTTTTHVLPSHKKSPSPERSTSVVTKETTTTQVLPGHKKSPSPNRPGHFVTEESTIRYGSPVPKKSLSPERPAHFVTEKPTNRHVSPGHNKSPSHDRFVTKETTIRYGSQSPKKSPSPERPARFVNKESPIRQVSPSHKKSPSPERPGRIVTEETTTIRHVSQGHKKSPSPERPARFVTEKTTIRRSSPGHKKSPSPERPGHFITEETTIRRSSPGHKKSPSPERTDRFVTEETTIRRSSPGHKKSPSPERPDRFVTEETATIRHISKGHKKSPSPERTDRFVTEETTTRYGSPAPKKSSSPERPDRFVTEETTIRRSSPGHKKSPSPERPGHFVTEEITVRSPGHKKSPSPERPARFVTEQTTIRRSSPGHKKSPSPERPDRFETEQTTTRYGSPAPKKFPSPERPDRFVTEETTTIRRSSPGHKKSPSPERPGHFVTEETTIRHTTPANKKSPSPERYPKADYEQPKSYVREAITIRNTAQSPRKSSSPETSPKPNRRGSSHDEPEAKQPIVHTIYEKSVTEKQNIINEENNLIFEVEEEPQRPGRKSKPKTMETTYITTSIRDMNIEPEPQDIEVIPQSPKSQQDFPNFEQYPENSMPKNKRPLKPSVNINEEFIRFEASVQTTPDGAFISKVDEPKTPTSPTFRKKGTTHRETFQERCRNILGMENYGETQGTFKKSPEDETKPGDKEPLGNEPKVQEPNKKPEAADKEPHIESNVVFQVKIEDCGEDDENEPFSITSVRKTLHKQINGSEQPKPKTTTKTAVDSETEQIDDETFPDVSETYTPKEEKPTTTTKRVSKFTEEFEKEIINNSKPKDKPSRRSPKKSDSPTREYIDNIEEEQLNDNVFESYTTKQTKVITTDDERTDSLIKTIEKPARRSPKHSPEIKSPTRSTKSSNSPVRESPVAPRSKSPVTEPVGRKSPVRDYSTKEPLMRESPGRQSPVKEYPEKHYSDDESPVRNIPERKSSIKQPIGERSPVRESSDRRSPVKELPGRHYPTGESSDETSPVRGSPIKERTRRDSSSRKSPLKEPIGERSPVRESPDRRSPVKELPGRRYPAEESPDETSPVRGSPAKEHPERYSFSRRSPIKEPTGDRSPLRESPSRRSPVKEHPGRHYPTGESPDETSPVRGSPIKQHPARDSPSRKSPLKEPIGERSPVRESPGRRSPVKEYPGRHYPSGESPDETSPVRGSPIKEHPARDTTVKQTFISEYTQRVYPHNERPDKEVPLKESPAAPGRQSPDEIYLVEISSIRESTRKDRASKETLVEKSPVRGSPKKDRPSKETLVEKSPVRGSPRKDRPSKETSVETSPVRGSPRKDRPSKETPVETSPVRASPRKDHPSKETPVETSPVRGSPRKDRPRMETPGEKSPVRGSPMKDRPRMETPGEKTPVRESPMKDRPSKETPVEKSPTRGSPMKERPTKEAPVEKSPVRGSPTKERPTKEAPGRQSPVKGSPIRDYPNKESAGRHSPVKGSPMREYPNKESAGRHSPVKSSPMREYPNKESPGRHSPVKGSPMREYPNKESPGRQSPVKSSPMRGSPVKETPAKKSPQKKSTTTTNDSSTIKDRLRSSTRKTKTTKSDQVDGTDSDDTSRETSPERYPSERRRSSNISVNTEIIIEHMETEKSSTHRHKTDSVYKNIIDSTTLPEKMPRKMPVTERKESAPVHRVTRKDKDSKMSRSTSENLIKVTERLHKKPEAASLAPTNRTGSRHPNKCFSTKTINLSATDRLINSEDMENVIIDIQHAKSSREPSPDKIVPTPVPANFDIGKPRYPDVVQEPEDEPRKRGTIKNVPIFEEETQTFVGCHISEVDMEKSSRTIDFSDHLDEVEVLSNPLVEAPQSLDYPSMDSSKPVDDECLLTVHEKVSKFQHTAEEIKKPKASSPFNREPLEITLTNVTQDDECLLSINEKVDKFLKTAENVTKPITPVRELERRPNFEELDDELRKDDCILSVSQKVNKFISTAEKLAPTTPQRSPELVRNISRNISRQSEPEEGDEVKRITEEEEEPHTDDDDVNELTEFELNEATTSNNEQWMSQHGQQHKTTRNSTTKQMPVKLTKTDHKASDDDDGDELIPHTATHTTRIEERRQKDILNRPSVFDAKRTSTNTNTVTLNSSSSNSKSKQTKTTSPVKEFDKPSTRRPVTTTTTIHKLNTKTQPKELNPKTAAPTTTRIITKTTHTTTPQGRGKPSAQRLPTDIISNLENSKRAEAQVNVTTKTIRGDLKKNSTKINESVTRHNTRPQQTKALPKEKQPGVVKTTVTSFINSPLDKNLSDLEMEYDTSDIENEMIISSEEQQQTRHYKEHQRQPIEISHSSRSPSPGNNNKKPHDTHEPNKIQSTVVKHNILVSSHNKKFNSTSTTDGTTTMTVQDILERTPTTTTTTASPKITGKKHESPQSSMVAAKRSIFENNQNNGNTTTTTTNITNRNKKPLDIPAGRRPSYMEHTKASLEHTRRDSLEINKNNYSRKPSNDDGQIVDRSTLVKFNVPQRARKETTPTTALNATTEPKKTAALSKYEEEFDEDDIEEIFDLEVLERLLEMVSVYELRRRIRAQIRLVKKNHTNEELHSRLTSKTTTSSIIKTSRPATDNEEEPADSYAGSYKKPKSAERSHSPSARKSSERSYSPSARKPSERSHSPDARKPSERSYSPSARKPGERSHSPDTRQPSERSHSPSARKPSDRSHSPQGKTISSSLKEVRRDSSEMHSSTTHKEHYISETQQYHEVDTAEERQHSPSRKSTTSPTRKSAAPASPHAARKVRRDSSTERRKPQQISPQRGRPTATTTPQSPQRPAQKTSLPRTAELKTTSLTSKTKPNETKTPQTPVWADRKNILKSPASGSPVPSRKAPTSSSSALSDSRSNSFRKTTKSSSVTSSSQKKVSSKTSMEEDCITSSYGIGPTDENGLPLFGIRALKKKKAPVVEMEPSETTEEVTGYVVEEKYYSDNKTKPIVERKEYIYSTNPEELEKIKDKVKGQSSSNITRKAITNIDNDEDDIDIRESRQYSVISKSSPTRSSVSPDDLRDSPPAQHYVRRGSVKEMSEKFIRKESSSSITEKTSSSSYPKAGLILRTNSRKQSNVSDDYDGNDNDDDCFVATSSTKTSTSKSYRKNRNESDNDFEPEPDYEQEFLRKERKWNQDQQDQQRSSFTKTESESECESVKTQKEFKKTTSSSMTASSSSTSAATKSFLNTRGEEKYVSGVDDVLERMRNADNVVEEGDTAEDQEARSLLNKFLGASVLMKGVESVIPAQQAAANKRQTKTITTYTTSNNGNGKNFSDDNDLRKQEVKTTRITKTIKSGNSSAPVIETTCDLEEIWDEEILKELLEQAKTYDERRKIRARLRELMADREEKNQTKAGIKAEPIKESKQPSKPEAEEEEESSASEYEEIIEEVTDYSDSEEEEEQKEQQIKPAEKQVVTKKTEETSAAKAENTKVVEELAVAKEASTTSIVESTSSAETASTVETTSSSESIQEPEPQDSVDSVAEEATTEQKTAAAAAEEAINSSNNDEDNTDSSSSVKGESEQPLLQNIATNSETAAAMHQAKTAKQKSVVNNKNTTNGGSLQTNSAANQNKTTMPLLTVTQQQQVRGEQLLSTGQQLVVGNNNSTRQVDRLGVPQKEDSGTESGEDLRLIAAGLRDQLQMKSDSNIIDDVTSALSRLESSLLEGKGIAVEAEKRKALLALVARLQAGLSSPEKLAEIAAAMNELDGGNDVTFAETSSPEADAHRSSKQRFGKRRSRVDRHTVGVSREELADARRFMEDMLIIENMSQNNSPDTQNVNVAPQWYPLEKNASTSCVSTKPRDYFTAEGSQWQQQQQQQQQNTTAKPYVSNQLNTPANRQRRPLSGEYSVSFNQKSYEIPMEMPAKTAAQQQPPQPLAYDEDAANKQNRFAANQKRYQMKRANTIDLSKTVKYNPEFDTDSDAEDKGPAIGLKRAVQVNVKKRAQNVVPPFEPKTENDRKFLAFINKQSDKPGLGWNSSRSVSNWTNKFGSIKHTFEVGAAATATTGKPPQVPSYAHGKQQAQMHRSNAPQQHSYRPDNAVMQQTYTNQQIAQRLQKEAERQAAERRHKLEIERLEQERRERDKLERQRQEYERRERDRLEREYYEMQRMEHERRATAAHHASMPALNVVKPIPVNEFKHAPQSVFRPIDNVDAGKPIYKPIAQMPASQNNNIWQPTQSQQNTARVLNRSSSPSQHLQTRPDNSFITSPPPSTKSPIALPWASRQTVDNSDFKNKAHLFETRSKYDNCAEYQSSLQRHNSLRSPNGNVAKLEEYKKRPSLPNTADPYAARNAPTEQSYLAPSLPYLPPPVNIAFKYADVSPKTTYQSYPCLPLAVDRDAAEMRNREDSLTNPQAQPLVLSSANPSYCPATQQQPPPQQLPLPRQMQFDYVSPIDSAPPSPNIYRMAHTDVSDNDIDSDYPLEYRAVSKVMGKPQSQTAVTVGKRTAHVSDDEVYGKNSREAKSLLSTMKKLGKPKQKQQSKQKPAAAAAREEKLISPPATCLSPDGRSYQAPLVEPIFPEVTKFEPNRQPVYAEQKPSFKQPTPQSYGSYEPALSYKPAAAAQPIYKPSQYIAPQQITNNMPDVAANNSAYKSYENLSQQTKKITASSYSAPKPYTSETQASYVVTYPLDDSSDDEAQHRHLTKAALSSIERRRNISETSTASSNTTSQTYSSHTANNVPSPNTSWTSNPIVENVPHVQQQQQQQMYAAPPVEYQQPAQMPAAPASYQTPQYAAVPEPVSTYPKPKQSTQPAINNYGHPNQQFTAANVPTKPQKQQEANVQIKAKPAIQQKPSVVPAAQPLANQTKPKAQAQSNSIISSSKSAQQQTVKTSEMLTSSSKSVQQQQSQTTSELLASNNKRNLMSMRKSVSEDYPSADAHGLHHQSFAPQQTVVSKQIQKREQLSNVELRRKSLGNNNADYQQQHRNSTHIETEQQQTIYKSSAPENTPDIVKSSLPKDENQPILKKYGPPQRHHYMPNSYQSPLNEQKPAEQRISQKSAVQQTTTTTQNTSSSKSSAFSKQSSKSILKSANQKQSSVLISKAAKVDTRATPQPEEEYIPRNIVYNNISAFTSMSRRQNEERIVNTEQPIVKPVVNKLSKCDSWNQILQLQQQQQQQNIPHIVPKIGGAAGSNELRRSKSGHSLAVPKMYEAGITREEVNEKQKTVAAYFQGQKSPTQQMTEIVQTKKSVINRTKTSEKMSAAASRKSMGSSNGALSMLGGSMVQGSVGGLTRSATMPHIASLNLLDETNVEDAFEQLMMAQKSATVTEKTETKEKDGAVVTTTTKVTTRTVSGTSSANKPVSPFNKFKQLDKQNSQQSAKSPTTPGGPSSASPTTGNAPIFRFTDPALNARAATVKEQLLQWCQMKTQEYENVQITNFSASWSDGLAFCALIHHFLPDAFDYSQLTAQTRRKNFEIAFTVADEKAGIAPLLDVEDMVEMKRPDWKCVFIYVQSIWRRFRNCQ